MNAPRYTLVLTFGLVLAAAAFVYWTVIGYAHFDTWTPDGLFRAVFVLGAVGLLAGVLRLARWLTDPDDS